MQLAGDNWQRANGAIGANYTALYGKTMPTIVSNYVESPNVANDAGAYYSGISWLNDHWVLGTLKTLNYADCANHFIVRAAAAAATWYLAAIGGPLGASATYQIAKLIAGVKTTIQAAVTNTFSTGDQVWFGVQGRN